MPETEISETPTEDPQVQKWVGQFVFLRDYVREQEEKHTEALRQVKADMETLKGKMLEFAKHNGLQNVASPAGTFYLTKKHSAKIVDQQEFMRHVIGTESWDLMDKKCNGAAAREWAEANGGQAPPGVELTTVVDVNVNRPKAKK